MTVCLIILHLLREYNFVGLVNPTYVPTILPLRRERDGVRVCLFIQDSKRRLAFTVILRSERSERAQDLTGYVMSHLAGKILNTAISLRRCFLTLQNDSLPINFPSPSGELWVGVETPTL